MKVAILGAGAIGFASAAILAARGHQPVLWSPSGRRTQDLLQGARLTSTGVHSGEWSVAAASDIGSAIEGSDAVLLAVDMGAHRAIMELAAPHLTKHQIFIVGAAHAMTALWLSRALSQRHTALPIVSWNTSLATAHQESLTQVTIRSVRPSIEMSVIGDADAAIDRCRVIFGERFSMRANALEIALLANCNPVFHVPVALLNMTRIERGEEWKTYQQTTEAVGRLIEAIDAERIAIGRSFGAHIHTVNEHFHRSFKIALGSMAQMNHDLHASGRGPHGAISTDHRHITQDVPFGLVFASELARYSGTPTPIHDSTVAIMSAALGRDFAQQGPLAALLGGQGVSKDELLTLAANGF